MHEDVSTSISHELAGHLISGNATLTELELAQRDFLHHGFVKVPFLVPASVKKIVGDEVEHLIREHSVRRDLVFAETGNTARRMRNVRYHEITRHGAAIPAVYSSPLLHTALQTVAGEEVLECPYAPERYVITELTQPGDTHGWHWDDYSFALVWVIDCPPLQDGGFVQCVPRTTWNKQDPQLHRQFTTQPIHSHELQPGDLYLLRTDTTLHRVFPVTRGRRLIINMGYAANRDLTKPISHETMDNLWNGSRGQ
jgi:hypothetical protein